MARYSGPAGRGASRTMAAVRRAEAETRQAQEQQRKTAWRPWTESEPPTAAELDALRDAMLRNDALEAYRQTWTRGER